MAKRINLNNLKSGLGTFQFVKLNNNFDRQLSASAVVPDLTFPVKSGEVYDFKYSLWHSCSNWGNGVRVEIHVPAARAFTAKIDLPYSTTSFQTAYISGSGGGLTSFTTPGANVTALGQINGSIIPTEDGQIQIWFGSEATITGSQVCTLLNGSHGILTKYI